jgi:hypothetical protein
MTVMGQSRRGRLLPIVADFRNDPEGGRKVTALACDAMGHRTKPLAR